MGDSETVYLHAVVNIVVAVIISIDKNAAVKVWSGIVTALGLVLTGGIVAAFSMVAAAVLIGVACFSLIQFRKLPQPENNRVKAITQRAECEEYNLDEKKKVFEETTELLRRERIAYDLNPDSLPVNWPDKKQISDAKDRIQYQNVFHLAVCGVSGTGKSSLINALRGLTADEANAAPIGTTETTKFALRYPDPRETNLFSRFVWYDFPGAGTPTIPREDYFNKQGLFLFDFIIVVYNVCLLLHPIDRADSGTEIYRDRCRHSRELPVLWNSSFHCSLHVRSKYQWSDGRCICRRRPVQSIPRPLYGENQVCTSGKS